MVINEEIVHAEDQIMIKVKDFKEEIVGVGTREEISQTVQLVLDNSRIWEDKN